MTDDNQNNTTAGDEAKQIQNEQKPRVRVSVALANGLVLNNHLDADGNPTNVASIGTGGPIQVKGSMEVDKDFYDAWAMHNKDLINRGLVSAVPVYENDQNDAEGIAANPDDNDEQDEDSET
jgi:hypothetical protein